VHVVLWLVLLWLVVSSVPVLVAVLPFVGLLSHTSTVRRRAARGKYRCRNRKAAGPARHSRRPSCPDLAWVAMVD